MWQLLQAMCKGMSDTHIRLCSYQLPYASFSDDRIWPAMGLGTRNIHWAQRSDRKEQQWCRWIYRSDVCSNLYEHVSGLFGPGISPPFFFRTSQSVVLLLTVYVPVMDNVHMQVTSAPFTRDGTMDRHDEEVIIAQKYHPQVQFSYSCMNKFLNILFS